jgi:hypothetical protein
VTYIPPNDATKAVYNCVWGCFGATLFVSRFSDKSSDNSLEGNKQNENGLVTRQSGCKRGAGQNIALVFFTSCKDSDFEYVPGNIILGYTSVGKWCSVEVCYD